MSNFSELSYAPPELGETHGRFACPANTEHSKFLNSYELFKYHIVNCRQLRALGEAFICKFCTRLFKNPSKRDTHQFSCSCRMEKGNEVFEMPEKLRNKYTLNQLVFEDYNEVVAIVNNFPQNQPCSAEYNNSPGGLSNIDEDNDGTDECKSDSKLEQFKKTQQDVHSCCDKESQLESHREQEQDLGDEEDLTELGQLRQIYQKNILLQQEQQQKQVREQQLQHQSQEETVNASIQFEQLQAEEIINTDQRESSLMIAEPNDDGTNQDRYNNSIQNPIAMIDLKKVNLLDSKKKYSEQAQNYEEEQVTLLENQRKDDGNMLNNDGLLFQMDEEEGVTSNKDMKSSRDILLVSENEVAESDLENMQHQLGLLRVDNDLRRASEDESCGMALSREDQKKPSQKASSRQLQGRQVVKLEEQSLVETNNQNQEEVSNNSDKDSNNNQEQPPNNSTSKDPSLCIERSDSKHQKNEELSSKIKEENQDEYDEFEDPITDLELTDQKIQKVVEVRVVELMRSITLKFKDPHQNDITSPILLAIHRKVFMKVDFSLVFMKFNETKDEKVLDCVDSLVCLGQNEIVFFTQFLQHLKAPFEPLIFMSHNVPSICDFFSRGSLQLVSETLQKSEHIFVLIVELKQHPNFNFDLINYESIQISVRKYVGFSVWDKNQQQKVFHLSEEDLTEEYLKNIAEQYDPFSQETIIFDTLYSRELQTLSLEREQSMQHLLDKRERLCENRGQEQENELFRLKQESILERQINLKRTETQRITQTAVQIEQEIKQLLQQVSKFKAGLSSEIEKGFQRAKMQSDEIYESQITRHQADFLLLAKENTSEKIEYLNQLKAQHKNLIKEQLEVIYEQRKIGNLMLAYHQEEAELKRMVEQKDRQISMHKSQQQTAYPCVICRKYPQNCHQKPCGHVLCCFYCVSKENDSKGTIFCKLCKVEIIKFSEIKYKVG